MFPNTSLCKTCDPQGGSILAPGHYLHKLDWGPLDDATYQLLYMHQGSRRCGLRQQEFFMLSLYNPM